MSSNPFNTSNNIAQDDQQTFDQLLLQIMQERYPDLQAYREGRLLNEPILPVSEIPPLPVVTEKIRGSYQVDLDVQQDGNIQFKSSEIGSLQPSVTEEDLTELIDEEFTFFQDDEEEVIEDDEELVDDKFITLIDVKKVDLHDAFLTGEYPVIYLEKGDIKIYPNYKTLEVDLTDKGLTYDDLEIVTDDEFAKFNLAQIGNEDFRVGKMFPDRSNFWSLPIRFESGYRPVLPFKRDPADYDDGNGAYRENAFSDQTTLEFLRAKYEGKAVIYDVAYGRDDRQRIDKSEIQNKSGTNIPELNVDNLRIMIKGFWKAISSDSANPDSALLRQYKIYNNLDTLVTEDVPQTVERLVLEGGIESLEANDGTNSTLNSQGRDLPVWNDFPHVRSTVDILDIEEYKTYWESTNQGDPFDIEYLEPYEPAGSIKYFSAGESQLLASQAAASYQEAIDEQEAYAAAFGPMQVLLDQINDGITAANEKLNSLQNNLVNIETYKSSWDTIYSKVFHCFYNDEDSLSGDSNDFQLIKKSNGSVKRRREDVFNTVNKKTEARRNWNIALARLDKVSDTGKRIGNRAGTSVLTLRDDAVRSGYGNGTIEGDYQYDPDEKSPFKSKSKFKKALARGIYNIYAEFERYISALESETGNASDAIAAVTNARGDLINSRVDLFTPNGYDGDPVNTTFAVNLDKALYNEAYQNKLNDVINKVNIIQNANESIGTTAISNSNAQVQNVFNSMKRAIYLKAYRMMDLSRRKVERNTKYDIRISNRTVNILQSELSELQNTNLYFRDRNIPGGSRSAIEALYNAEIDFLYQAFVTELGMQSTSVALLPESELDNFFNIV